MFVTLSPKPIAVGDGLSVRTTTQSAASRLLDNTEDLSCPQEISSNVLVAHSQARDFDEEKGAFFPFPTPQCPPPYCPPRDCDEAFEVFREWIGWSGEAKVRPERAVGPQRKTVVINDLHVPDHDEESLRLLIENEAADTDELVIAGDFATMFAWSRFPKFKQTHTAREEIITSTKVLRLLAEAFPKVKLFGGNHDERFVKWLIGDCNMTPEMLDAIEFMNPGFSSPLAFMAKGLPNVEIVTPVEYEKAKFAFLYQFGDAVVCHAETYSKIPNRATSNVSHWLKSFAEPIGLVKPFRIVGQAHTHQQGKVFGDYATWLFELGCFCQIEDYVGSAKIMTPRPWVKGYSVFIQDAETGRTDINASHFIHTGRF